MNYTKTKLSILSLVVVITIASIVGMSSIQETIPKVEAQVPVDAMTEITNQVVTTLTTGTGGNRELNLENIRQAESLVFGKPVILVTNSVPDTWNISADYDFMTSSLKGALLSCASGSCVDGMVQAEAKELADRITYWQETKHNLEQQTMNAACDVNNPATCPQLNLGDEPQAIGPGISVGIDKIWDGWYREVRSPYAIVEPFPSYPGTNTFPANGKFLPSENIITVGPLAIDECSTVIKEIQGVKAIQRAVKIPIWQEPWTSRASIIGFNTVWVVDFIPAEFVKSLNYCNHAGVIDFDYTIDVIIERELTHFWKFLPAGMPSGVL
jgi:hypothetical protein